MKPGNLHNDPTDQFFRDKMSDLDAVAPMSEWPPLEEKVRAYFEKRKKRRFIIFFFLLFLGAGGTYLLTANMPDNNRVSAGSKDGSHFGGEQGATRLPVGRENNKPQNKGVITSGEDKETSTSITQPGGRTTSPTVQPRIVKAPHQKRSTTRLTNAVSRKKAKQEISKNTVNRTPEATIAEEYVAIADPVEKTEALAPDTTTAAPVKRDVKNKTPSTPILAEAAENNDKFSWMDIHVGLNRTSPRLSGQTSQPGYLDKRRNEESPSVRVSFGVNFYYKVNRIIGSFGADITSYGESVDYSNQAVKRFQWVAGGQYVYTDSVITSQSFVAQKKNRLNYVEFPVYIGYEFPTKGKLGISVMGGLTMGFLLNSTHTYIDTALTGAYVYENRKNESFRQQVFSAGILPSLEYRTTSFSQIYIAFPVRYHLSSVMHHDSDIKQRYFSPGVRLGYRIFMKGQ